MPHLSLSEATITVKMMLQQDKPRQHKLLSLRLRPPRRKRRRRKKRTKRHLLRCKQLALVLPVQERQQEMCAVQMPYLSVMPSAIKSVELQLR